MEKLLNIGAPYIGLNGGDKERARFQLDALRGAYAVHNLLVARPAELAATLPAHEAAGPALGIPGAPGRGLRPASIYEPEASALPALLAKLEAERYPVAFFRYLGPTRLVAHVRRALPEARIVIDADMILSRIAQQAWRQDRRVGNRFFLFETFRVRRYEQWIFNEPHLFLMSNPDELAYVQKHFVRSGARSRFALVPNVMPDVAARALPRADEGPVGYLLFYGMLGSAVNRDAFRFLVTEIYPRLHDALEARDLRIRVVGRGLCDFHRDLVARHGCGRIELAGEAEDIGAEVAGAMVCLAPLRMGSGTKTRVLEAAAYGTCVVTTPLGAEGLDFDADELIVEGTAEGIAAAVRGLLADPDARRARGERLRAKCVARYSREAVGRQLLEAISGA